MLDYDENLNDYNKVANTEFQTEEEQVNNFSFRKVRNIIVTYFID